jgi:hypothetical protein
MTTIVGKLWSRVTAKYPDPILEFRIASHVSETVSKKVSVATVDCGGWSRIVVGTALTGGLE